MESQKPTARAIEIVEIRRVEDFELPSGVVVIAEIDVRIVAAGLRIIGARLVRELSGKYNTRMPPSKSDGKYVFYVEDSRHLIELRDEAVEMLREAGVLEQF